MGGGKGGVLSLKLRPDALRLSLKQSLDDVIGMFVLRKWVHYHL
jgi:hypothetical protein